MIKLQDFAASRGVTDKAIYKHLKKYAADLENHIEKRGKNGTWLDDYACEYISKLMVSNPVVLSEASDREEIERLRKKVEELQDKLAESNEKGRNLAEAMLAMKDEMTNLQLENRSLQLKIEHQEEKKHWWQFFKK